MLCDLIARSPASRWARVCIDATSPRFYCIVMRWVIIGVSLDQGIHLRRRCTISASCCPSRDQRAEVHRHRKSACPALQDSAERAIGYGIPGVIVDDLNARRGRRHAARDAVERAHRGEGPTLIEATDADGARKGHAIHDAAAYVPKPMFEFWKKRDPIARFENYLVKDKKWLTAKENADLISEVERVIEEEREIAGNSPAIRRRLNLPKEASSAKMDAMRLS